MEEETHQIGTINLIDALVDVFPSMRDELFEIRQRSFRISNVNHSYHFISKGISDLLLGCDDINLLLDKGIPIVGDFFSNRFTGCWDWHESPLAELLKHVPHADSFFVMGISFPRWASPNTFSLMRPERSRNAHLWKIELAARRRRWNTYSFQLQTANPVEFAIENGAFAFANHHGMMSYDSTFVRSFIFYFDDEESQILSKIKYPEGRIMDWMQTIRRGKDHAF